MQQAFKFASVRVVFHRKLSEEIFTCCKESVQNAKVLPVFVQAFGVLSVRVVVEIKEVLSEQIVQLASFQHFCFVR